MKNKPEKNTTERRCLVKGLEIRDNEDGSKTLVGQAAVFMPSRSVDLGGFIEQINANAFDETLDSGPDVVALVGHDPNQPLARRSKDTLRIEASKTGLDVEIDLPNTSRGRDLAEDIAAGTIEGMSFGFNVLREEWEEPENVKEPALRTLLEVRLIEVSPTAFPAYPDTTLAVRSLDGFRESSKDQASRNLQRLKDKQRHAEAL